MSKTTLKRKRPLASLGTAVGIALMLTACAEDSANNGTDAPDNGAETTESADVDAARANIAELTAKNVYEAPSEPYDPGDSLDGELISVIVSGANAPFVQEFVGGVEDAATELGARLDVQDSDYDMAKASELIDKAVAAGATAIIMQSIDATAVAASVEAASDAGLIIIEATSRDAGPVPEDLSDIGVSAISSFCYTCAGAQMADAAIDVTAGTVNALIYNVPGLAVTSSIVDGFESQLDDLAPGSTVTVVEAPVADWESSLASLTTSNLQTNPDINVLVPVFDSMVGIIEPALVTAGLTDKSIVTYNASDSVLAMMENDDLVKANIGGSPYWLGWASIDQVARIQSGNAPVEDVMVPHRQFDESNIADVDLEAPQQTWYGDIDLPEVYAELWSRS